MYKSNLPAIMFHSFTVQMGWRQGDGRLKKKKNNTLRPQQQKAAT